MLLAPIKSFRVRVFFSLVTVVKSYIYISPTGRNNAVSNWRKILHIRQPTGRNYAVSYWRKILHKILHRLKAIVWHSVSFRMTCYHRPDEKTLQILSLHFVPSLQSTFCIRSAVCCLHFVLTGIRGTNTGYSWLQLFAQHTQSTTKYLCVS